MLVSLVMSASIPEAFGDRGLAFAAAYVALTIGRTLLVLAALGRGHHVRPVYARPLVWWSATGVLWIAGGLSDGDAWLAIWIAAFAIEYVGVAIGFPVPGRGHTESAEYTIAARRPGGG